MQRERGTQAEINTAHISHNLNQFKSLHPGKIIAVVKADAYGHGLATVVPHLKAADAFAVATIEEAIELRAINPDKAIILLEGVFNAEELTTALNHNFDVVVHQKYQIELLKEAQSKQRIDVWLKIDTGMNRLGFNPTEAEAHLKLIHDLPLVNQLRVMTHYASSDDVTAKQTQQQQTLNDWVKTLGYECSFSNTAAVLNQLSKPNEWVRVGIGLFGISPLSDRWAASFKLKPVMRMTAKIIATKDIQKGDLVGYGGTFQAKHPMRIGIVGMGYADGYPWTEKQSHVMVQGHKAKIIGRVSMDMMAIDLTDLSHVLTGFDVEAWGENWPIEAVADELGLIPYTLTCGITKRVKFNDIQ
ncbi:alanine racemase [Marinicella litoralis]|uniref:Alanine racemase n=1 Tax=Marinicella litoralis TaxID=644220 RepID=A0A4R6XHU8_9GAMM|nr:alanine racemase [Marinicella litoralis]TDR17450.1 alanine racemase [Marinicella litoralis]